MMTPQNSRELIRWIEMLGIGCQAPAHWPYRSISDLVLREGFLFGRSTADYCGKMAKGECFRNAATFGDTDPKRYVYCEGYAASVIPIMHGWVYDRKMREVIELTWDEPARAYCGLAMDVREVWKYSLRRRKWGVIDAYDIRWPLLSGEVKVSAMAARDWRIVEETDSDIIRASEALQLMGRLAPIQEEVR